MSSAVQHAARFSLLLVAGAAVACVGGGGGLAGAFESWETSPRTGEPAGNTQERPPVSTESHSESSGAGGGGAGALDCSGTYLCQEVGDDDTDRVTLRSTAGGGCSAEELVLEADGRLTVKGRAVGSWSMTGTGFSVVTPSGTVNCTKASADSSSRGDSNQGGSGNSGSGSSNPGAGPAVGDAGG